MLALALVASLVLAGCDSGADDAVPTPTPSPATSSAKPVDLTFGVFGGVQEVGAFQAVVNAYDKASKDSNVTIRSWPDHAGLMRTIENGGKVPDVFLVNRGDLATLEQKGLTQPVDELLDERGVDFGDGYARDALEAFSADNRLQCMPYGISPMVIYYNKKLVDFTKMQARGLDAPDPEGANSRWTFDQFTAAAKFAARPLRHTSGFSVEPTLRGLAPFIYSGGGKVFNDDNDPTSLAFSDGGTEAALRQTLELLRDPHLTLTPQQLAKATPLQWFERGRLGMIAGFRSLVPQLRGVPGLDFDVIPMPVLGSAATVGDITGLCLSKSAASTPEAADFLVHAISAEMVGKVARAGYLAPANLEVASSEDFLQPTRLPEHAGVFNTAVRAMVIPPLGPSWTELQTAVGPSLRQLVEQPVLDDLDAIAERIDAESQPVLAPPESGSPSPSQ